MLDFTRPNAYADLGANLTRIYANAALSAFVAAASQGLMLWSGLISASLPRMPAGDISAVPPLLRTFDAALAPDWQQFSLPYSWLSPSTNRDHRASERIAEPRKMEASLPSFSAYRSDGGHAVAQVIVG